MRDLEALRIVLSMDPATLLSARDGLCRTPLHIVAERGGSVSIWRRESNIPGYLKTVAQMGFDIHANCGLGWTVLDHHTSKLWSHIDRGRGFRYRRSHSHRVLKDTKYLVVGGVACHRPNTHRLDPLDVAALLETHLRFREYPAEPFEPDFNFKALKDSKVLIDAIGKSSIKFLRDHGSDLSNSGALWTAIQHRVFWSLVFLLMAGADVTKRTFARTPLEYTIEKVIDWLGSVNDSIIRVLLDFGADIDAMTYDQELPSLRAPLLHQVIRKHLVESRSRWPWGNAQSILDLLLRRGPHVNLADSAGNVPPHIACEIYTEGSETASSTSPPMSRLSSSSSMSDLSLDSTEKLRFGGITRKRLFQKLLAHGAIIDARNQKGETPLLMACRKDCCLLEAIRFLCSRVLMCALAINGIDLVLMW